jgi:hypothetical protein
MGLPTLAWFPLATKQPERLNLPMRWLPLPIPSLLSNPCPDQLIGAGAA